MSTAAPATPGGVITRRASGPAFTVVLDNFEGPFDLLLGLIAKHQLDVTEISLATVTDEFVAHLRSAQAGGDWDLSQTSEFVLIAATLLELKAARLLPRTGEVDDEDFALIEARDLLFARLLQYRAFKEVASIFQEQLETGARMVPRQAGLDPEFATLLPDLIMHVSPDQLALVAARALTPKEAPQVGLEHLHAPTVSVRAEAGVLTDILRREKSCSFRTLIQDAETTIVIVARFLAVLELYRERAVTFEQAESLGELVVRWVGSESGEVQVHDDYDDEEQQ